ncbi:12752_t:CDS:2, partial [Funneliformis geosporum]
METPERKEEVNNLSIKCGGGGNTRAKLWQDASAISFNDNFKYSAEQCANKWKNIKKNYKSEVEEILDGNRPSLTPKVLDSSLNIGDLDNLFYEITG